MFKVIITQMRKLRNHKMHIIDIKCTICIRFKKIRLAGFTFLLVGFYMKKGREMKGGTALRSRIGCITFFGRKSEKGAMIFKVI